MSKKVTHPIKYTLIASLLLMFTLSIAWAGQTYNGSVTVKKGRGGTIRIITATIDGLNLDLLGLIRVKVYRGALDEYMEQQGVDRVTVTVEVEEERVVEDNGNSYYLLNFTFGPSGAFFNPPLELKLTGKYVKEGADVWLYDENGEELEGERYTLLDTIIFKILHFSSYYYDDYY